MPFKKGDPNINRKGKPPGTYSMIAILKRKLAQTIKEKGKEAGEELVEVWLNKAQNEKGFEALKEIVHYTDGMPPQTIQFPGGIDIKVELGQQEKELLKNLIKMRETKV